MRKGGSVGQRLTRLFNNISIFHKLLLISIIPLLSLIVFSVATYRNVQTFSQDEERLNDLYLLQKTAALYMNLLVDLETGFRGYVVTEDPIDLQPYERAREEIIELGRDLAAKLPNDQAQHFNELQKVVIQFIAEKETLVQAIRFGNRAEALTYMRGGHGREIMDAIRKWKVDFDQAEKTIAQQELARVSQDRTTARIVMLGGGVAMLWLIVLALLLIAHSIANPLIELAKAVGATDADLVPEIPLLNRKDEIGHLTKVMHKMSLQIRSHLDELRHSETTLKKLNAHLSASEAKYRGIVDNAPFGIIMTKGVRITFSNRHNQALAGLDPEREVDPSEFRKKIHPEDRDRVLNTFSKAVAQGRPCEMIFRFLHDDGTIKTILSRRVPIMDLDRSDTVYVGFNIDISTLDEMQLRLRRAEKLATLGQVAAGIAHELRNPLVGIGSTAKGMTEEFDRLDPRRAEAEVILSETKRLDRIVNQIVDYARPRRVTPTRIDLSQLLDEAVRLLKPHLDEKHLKIRTSLLSSSLAGALYADRDQLRQVLVNVIHNAIDATPEHGSEIQVSSHELFRDERPGIAIQIKDEGEGISSEALPHVFEPFFTSGKRNGTGLGLGICKNIIESHEGDIYLSSEMGKGTIVGIWLPLEQERVIEKG